MTSGPVRGGWRRRALMLVGAALLLAWAVWWFAAPRGAANQASAPATILAQPVAAQAPSRSASTDQASAAVVSAPRVWLADRVGGASNLKQVFDAQIASADVRLRRAAAQAFAACLPAFLPASAETPSPESLIRALPEAQRTEREAAYRTLYARCQDFLGEGRAPLLDLQQRLQADGQLRQPGDQAMDDLLAGRVERVEPLVTQALGGGDPAAVASLAGLAEHLAQRRQQDTPDAAELSLARAVDAALPLVACDLGLNCGVDSLGALQLCATQGACNGDLSARLLSRAGANGLDPAAVNAQRTRLLSLIRSGRALGTADLLP